MTYKRLLKECFENATPETLQQKLTSSFFREKDWNSRKISSSIRETIAFSDFNRYYVRALLLIVFIELKVTLCLSFKNTLKTDSFVFFCKNFCLWLCFPHACFVERFSKWFWVFLPKTTPLFHPSDRKATFGRMAKIFSPLRCLDFDYRNYTFLRQSHKFFLEVIYHRLEIRVLCHFVKYIPDFVLW